MKENESQSRIFCMEYGLKSDFKLYAGGLGILAGDYLKAAKDNNLPVVGIGLLWKQDYTQQYLDEKGFPYDTFPEFNYDFLEDTGVKIMLTIGGRDVYCKIWKVDKFNNAPLYLLDTDIEENKNWVVTDQLYAGYSDRRIPQELVLGIGGIRAIRALGIDIDIYHFNEGHAVFAGIELIREKCIMKTFPSKKHGKSKKSNRFHYSYSCRSGNELHNLDMLWEKGMHNELSWYTQLKEIGGDPLNMTIAGFETVKKANAVSELHCKTANRMWDFVNDRAPIIAVTNGVHRNTWLDYRLQESLQK